MGCAASQLSLSAPPGPISDTPGELIRRSSQNWSRAPSGNDPKTLQKQSLEPSRSGLWSLPDLISGAFQKWSLKPSRNGPRSLSEALSEPLGVSEGALSKLTLESPLQSRPKMPGRPHRGSGSAARALPAPLREASGRPCSPWRRLRSGRSSLHRGAVATSSVFASRFASKFEGKNGPQTCIWGAIFCRVFFKRLKRPLEKYTTKNPPEADFGGGCGPRASKPPIPLQIC